MSLYPDSVTSHCWSESPAVWRPFTLRHWHSEHWIAGSLKRSITSRITSSNSACMYCRWGSGNWVIKWNIWNRNFKCSLFQNENIALILCLIIFLYIFLFFFIFFYTNRELSRIRDHDVFVSQQTELAHEHLTDELQQAQTSSESVFWTFKTVFVNTDRILSLTTVTCCY